MRRGLRILLESLVLEGLMAYLSVILFLRVADPNVFLAGLIVTVPFPIWVAIRSPYRPRRWGNNVFSYLLHYIVVSLGAGVVVVVGIVAFVWVGAYFNPCPPEAFECLGPYLGAIVATLFAGIIMLPSFLIITVVVGLVLEWLRWIKRRR